MHFFSPARPGFTAIEFILSAIPVLLVSLGAYELSLWYKHRHILNLALVEAARQGSVQHAHPKAIEAAFTAALTPLFVPSGPYQNAETRRDAYLKRIQAQAGQSWRILLEEPNPSHYLDFKRSDLTISQLTGHDAIDNNFQKEQHQRKSQGLFSGHTIYQANTLKLSLIYPYKPKVPGMSFLFKQLASLQTDPLIYDLMSKAGTLAIRSSLSITMQSHPVLWTSHNSSHVLYAHQLKSAIDNTVGNTSVTGSCTYGIWCAAKNIPSSTHIPSSNTSSSSSTTAPTTNAPPKPASTSPQTPEQSNSSLDESTNAYLPPIEHVPTTPKNFSEISAPQSDENLCGVSLCC